MHAISDRTIWWVNPAAPIIGAAGITGAAAYLIPAAWYEEQWRTAKYFSGYHLGMIAACLVAFVLGMFAVSRALREPARDRLPAVEISLAPARALFWLAFVLCLAGYAAWTSVAISRGMTLAAVLGVFTGEKGASYDMKEIYLVTVSGITTLTQFGQAAVILGCIIGCRHGWRRTAVPCAVIMILAVFRAILNSERLAVLELLVPAFVVLLQTLPDRVLTQARMRMVALAPVWAPCLLLGGFTASEFLRSWSNFYADRQPSLVSFAAGRLTGYYVTAANNSAIFIERLEEPLGVPFFTANFLYRFPVAGEAVKQWMPLPTRGSEITMEDVIQNAANIEFNNPGGILLPQIEFGPVFGLLYWTIAGMICGALFHLFRRNHPLGLCLYPLAFLTLLESSRILYWSEGKTAPPVLLLLFASWVLSRRAARHSPAEDGSAIWSAA